MLFCFFFFVKQKTAYEIYQCDWSSDVCSSDLNEEDHLRIQGIRSGFEMEPTWRMVDEIDDAIEGQVEYAFSAQFGYLTACPTNVGTGMRVSVMLHLPALAITRHIEKLFNAVAKMGLVVRGLYGEGTQAYGDLDRKSVV